MDQDHLTKEQKPMTDAAMTPPGYEAAEWADKLIRNAHRGPGDTVDAAMHRVSTKYRIDHHTLWRLRYRRPRDLMASAWKQIKEAYEIECKSVEAQVAHNLEMLRALPPSEARDRMVAQLEGYQADQAAEAKAAPHPKRRSTD